MHTKKHKNVGDMQMLGVEPGHLPDFRGLVSFSFGPHIRMGGCGGDFPPTIVARGSKGGDS